MEAHTHAIDAVALIGGRIKALSLENVAQVATAFGAANLDTFHAERIVLMTHHRAYHVS